MTTKVSCPLVSSKCRKKDGTRRLIRRRCSFYNRPAYWFCWPTGILSGFKLMICRVATTIPFSLMNTISPLRLTSASPFLKCTGLSYSGAITYQPFDAGSLRERDSFRNTDRKYADRPVLVVVPTPSFLFPIPRFSKFFSFFLRNFFNFFRSHLPGSLLVIMPLSKSKYRVFCFHDPNKHYTLPTDSRTI